MSLRRRDTDHVSWKRVGIGTVAASVVALWPLIAGGLHLHERWVEHEAAAVQVENIGRRLSDLEKKVERLERWYCRLGWRPPDTIGQRNCPGE